MIICTEKMGFERFAPASPEEFEAAIRREGYKEPVEEMVAFLRSRPYPLTRTGEIILGGGRYIIADGKKFGWVADESRLVR